MGACHRECLAPLGDGRRVNECQPGHGGGYWGQSAMIGSDVGHAGRFGMGEISNSGS